MEKQYENMFKSTDHDKPHFHSYVFMFFTTISTSKKMWSFFSELKKALRDTLTRAAWYGHFCIGSIKLLELSSSRPHISLTSFSYKIYLYSSHPRSPKGRTFIIGARRKLFSSFSIFMISSCPK